MTMAKISKSDAAPSGDLHVSLGRVDFDLTSKKKVYETTDPTVISDARAHVFLSVEEDAPAPVREEQADYDPNDPHDNPASDHLSIWASDEAVKAAAANEAAVRDAAGLAVHVSASGDAPDDVPTVEETINETLDAVGSDASAEVPNDEKKDN
jgi:hypothetical protein